MKGFLVLATAALFICLPRVSWSSDANAPDAPNADAPEANLPNAPSYDRDQAPQEQDSKSGIILPLIHRPSAPDEPPPDARGPIQRLLRPPGGWQFLGLTASLLAASIVDSELTQRCLDERTCNFLPSFLDSRAARYGVGIPADIGLAYLGYLLKQKRKWLWPVPEGVAAGLNAYVAHHAAVRIR